MEDSLTLWEWILVVGPGLCVVLLLDWNFGFTDPEARTLPPPERSRPQSWSAQRVWELHRKNFDWWMGELYTELNKKYGMTLTEFCQGIILLRGRSIFHARFWPTCDLDGKWVNAKLSSKPRARMHDYWGLDEYKRQINLEAWEREQDRKRWWPYQ